MATSAALSVPAAPAVRVRGRSGVIRRLLRKPQTLLGAILLSLVLVAAVTAPFLTRFPPDAQAVGDPFAPPSARHPFGTDQFGRDLWTRVLYGGRISLQIGLVAVAIGGTAGVVLGALAGYASGWVDEAAMRLIDILLAFPGILLAIAVVIMLGPGLHNLMIAVGIGAIPTFSRVVRAAVLDAKVRDYVTAARAMGAVDAVILVRHILPNTIAPIIVLATLDVATAILSGTALSYLGMGTRPPTAEWGLMLAEGKDYMRHAWWVGTFPGLVITLAVIGINLLGDGLRDTLDPRLKKAGGSR
ncbi:MAG: ABC transporter permease [Armatimonadetes bacterium]|nr:ABC transporter permease [Armatimonadota bacterium]